MQSRLGELGLHSIEIDDGGAGDCFFRSVSHQLYHHMRICTAGGDKKL